jgi:hypothetical protein
MIRKLAEELATNPTVSGENEALPLKEPSAPAVKDTATPDPEHGFTEHSGEGHAQTTHGFLDRAFDTFSQAGKQHEQVLAGVLGDHVRRVSGSSSTSQRAVQRFRNRGR